MRRQTNTINYTDDLPLAQGIKFDLQFFGSLNKSSTLHPRVLAIFNAKTVEGT